MDVTLQDYRMVTKLLKTTKVEKRRCSTLKLRSFFKEVPIGTLFVDTEPMCVKEGTFKGFKATLKIYRAYHKNVEAALVRYKLTFDSLFNHEETMSAEDAKKLCG